jgi:hypothetical protein
MEMESKILSDEGSINDSIRKGMECPETISWQKKTDPCARSKEKRGANVPIHYSYYCGKGPDRCTILTVTR